MDSDSVSAALAAPRPRPTAKIAACMLHRCKRHRGNLQILPPCRSVMLQTGGRSTGAHTNPDTLVGGIARALMESHCRLVLISAAGALRRMERRHTAHKECLGAGASGAAQTTGTTLAHSTSRCLHTRLSDTPCGCPLCSASTATCCSL